MEFRGERFTVNLSDDDDEIESSSTIPSNNVPSFASAFVADIKERSTKPPTAPQLKTSTTGFPEHRKRIRVSAFKKQRAGNTNGTVADSPNAFGVPPSQGRPTAADTSTQDDEFSVDKERKRIDEENKMRIASMSKEEIEQEQEELLATLDPSLIQRLLKRANLDDGRGDTGIDPPSSTQSLNSDENKNLPQKSNVEATPAPKPEGKPVVPQKSVTFEEDEEPTNPIDLRPASEISSSVPEVAQPSIHFPTASPVPDLDPDDPSFLENLHKKYYPSLPADPSKLAWMAPIPTHGSVADQESPYYPAAEALAASALRYDFRGGLLPPRIARAMPITKGLHHHGEAPEAAGYTIPELARLARSAFPAQRCIAFQTLGRFLYRLGRGEWGDSGTEMSKGLWRIVEEGKVIQTLEEAANAEGGHQGSKAYAIEALWLWQKGGGHIWKAD
ncbi:fea85caa-1e72-480f-996a-e3eaf41b61fd-CDS [Sclerotinia trifoliorum]|uniref:Fea85caa-1e72-480f-996a-e3eaf41b61fd-CDS n=1 Tax=Sclerotinia trifoliorum TaxID=28548 RepID=A0A8H2W4P4_9HELO|nr:fea85caa-1e72-480f-996a-e3eaf41b61fd-CDS [Sclerotinia trifoliorum]